MNIDVSGAGFRERLAAAMEDHRLSATLLARRARVDEATLHALRMGTRRELDAAVLARIADALGTDPDWLVYGTERPAAEAGSASHARHDLPTRAAARGRRPAFVAAIGAGAVALGILAWNATRTDPQVSCKCEDSSVEVRNGRNGRLMWHVDTGALVGFCVPGPWASPRVAVYATRPFTSYGGAIVVRDLVRGDSLWSYAPDKADMASLFPEEIAARGAFSPTSAHLAFPDCHSLVFEDLDRDGDDDMVVHWQWVPWYPCLIEWYSRESPHTAVLRVRGSYHHSGRLLFVRAVDLDRDGRPEVLAAGTNNASAHQGATLVLLDADHWAGGSVDSLAEQSHWAAGHGLSDGARARVVFPQMDAAVMRHFGVQRLDAQRLETRSDTSATRVVFGIGGDGTQTWVEVDLDAGLRPLDVRVHPSFRAILREAPAAVQAAFADERLRAWLGTHRRYAAGEAR